MPKDGASTSPPWLIAAVVEWARSRSKHISAFLSIHTWDDAGFSEREMVQTIAQGDNSSVPVLGIFIYAQGMPIILTRNTLAGLKMVHGAEFETEVSYRIRNFPDIISPTT